MKVTVWQDKRTGEIRFTLLEARPNPTPREGYVWFGTAELRMTNFVSVGGRRSVA